MSRRRIIEDLYLVTKHYGAGMVHHVGRATTDRREVDRTVKTHSKGKGKFRGKVHVRVWLCIDEREVG